MASKKYSKKKKNLLNKETEIKANTASQEINYITKKQLVDKGIKSPDLSKLKSERISRKTVIFAKGDSQLKAFKELISDSAI